MCLSAVRERVNVPVNLIESGWKTFNTSTGMLGRRTLKFQNVMLNGSYDITQDRWLLAEVNPVYGSNYESGFHIYSDERTLRSVKGGAPRRVYYRGVMTRGEQDQVEVIVAKEMYVPSDENAWPPQEG